MRRLPVVYADSAITDLWNLTEYIAIAAGSYLVATRFVDRIEARIKKIENAPLGGRDRSDLKPGLRTIPFERSAVVAYFVESDAIIVTNIFYGGQDFEAILIEENQSH